MENVAYFDYGMVEPDGDGGYAVVPYGERARPTTRPTCCARRRRPSSPRRSRPASPSSSTSRSRRRTCRFTPAPRHEGLFQALPPWRPPSYNEADVSDKPTWVQNTPPLTAEEQADLDQVRIDQLEMLQAVDEAIGGSAAHGIVGHHGAPAGARRRPATRSSSSSRTTAGTGASTGRARRTSPTRSRSARRCSSTTRGSRRSRGSTTRFALNIDLAPTFAELAGVDDPDRPTTARASCASSTARSPRAPGAPTS